MENNNTNQTQTPTRVNTKNLALIGMFGAVSAVLMFFEVSLPFIPPFIKLDFSELPVILGAYIMGPIAGTEIIILKILLKLVMKGTSTAFVGEISNMIGSFCYMLPAVLLYHKKKSKKGAAVSLLCATVIVSICLLITNTTFVFPAYAKLFGMDMPTIVGMAASTNPLVKDTFTMMLLSIFPFNLFKYGLTSIITFFVYKRLKHLLF